MNKPAAVYILALIDLVVEDRRVRTIVKEHLGTFGYAELLRAAEQVANEHQLHVPKEPK